jgi:hypothetical protein
MTVTDAVKTNAFLIHVLGQRHFIDGLGAIDAPCKEGAVNSFKLNHLTLLI